MKRAQKASVVAPRATASAEGPFSAVIDAFDGEPGISPGKMFGAVGLKVNGKVFAMYVKGKFVAKLPKGRVESLVSSGSGEYFDPGHGRPMKEWVALGGERSRWVDLAREARAFVKGVRP